MEVSYCDRYTSDKGHSERGHPLYKMCPLFGNSTLYCYITTHDLSMMIGVPLVSMLSYSHPSCTLTCVSTGGPATNVTWRKVDVIISPSSPSHQQSQRVVNTSTATYHNLLSITSSDISDYSGSFTCTVSNTRGSSQSMSLDINGRVDGSILFCLHNAIECYFYSHSILGKKDNI